MDSNAFMGMLIVSLVVLIGLAGTLTGFIIKPVINLNKNITKLNCTIETLQQNDSDTKNDLKDLKNITQKNSEKLTNHEIRINQLENKKG